jgi:hypothetical protein
VGEKETIFIIADITIIGWFIVGPNSLTLFLAETETGSSNHSPYRNLHHKSPKRFMRQMSHTCRAIAIIRPLPYCEITYMYTYIALESTLPDFIYNVTVVVSWL